MKVTQLNLKMFLDSVEALHSSGEHLKERAEWWLALQKNRENGYYFDQYEAQQARMRLEEALDDYRDQLAHTYDFQGDKGLVNFVPTGEYVDD